MASGILKMIAQSRSVPLNCASISARRYASTKTLRLSPFPELDSLMVDLSDSISRKVAGIQTTFVSPEIQESTYLGAGVCIDPTFVVTSVRVVARVAPIRDSGGSTRYRAYIGSTAGGPLNRDIEYEVKMKPVAVSFARDPQDPVVMDTWIDSEVMINGDQEDYAYSYILWVACILIRNDDQCFKIFWRYLIREV